VSLRHRIVVMVLVIMAVTITAADVVTSSAVHSYLIGRLDDQINDSQTQLVGWLDHLYDSDVRNGMHTARSDPSAWLGSLYAPPVHRSPRLPDESNGPLHINGQEDLASRVAPDDFVELIDTDGSLLYQHSIGPVDAPESPPDLPADLRPLPVLSGDRDRYPRSVTGQPPFSVGSIGSGTQYRIETAAVPGGILVTAASLAPSNTTLTSLAHIEILVSVALMFVLAALVAWTVRLGLRPLEAMTETAGAFAKGDLSRRVRFADERTEVGRLGRALNGMLVQIESAFSQREQSEERLRRFVADASHDLRTPLTSIRGYAELLRKGAFTDESERRRALGRIEHEAERMSVLVDDLLLLARLDQGRPVAREPVELRPLVADAVAAARAVDGDRPITLVAPHGVLIEGDAGRLRQAIDNLLRNALVHTPVGAAVEVQITKGDESVTLSVADNGPGIEPEQAKRVFERFFRADPSRTGQGTGLGLSIVSAIVEAHGGTTWVQSVVGVGSTFYIELPLEAGSKVARSDESGGKETPAGEDAPFEDEDVTAGEDAVRR
jgi:two-component system, OmpR family, sensor kinase